MARTKRTSRDLTKAQLRFSGIKSIDPKLDLGDGLTLTAYQAAIKDLSQLLEEYNTALAKVDQLTAAVSEMERQVRVLSGQMLSAVGCRFGKNSDEYVMAGGTRQRERSRISSSLLAAKAEADVEITESDDADPMMPAPAV